MGKIRVCQLITSLGLAGAERCVYELATRLDRGLFDVEVIALRGGLVADWLTQAGVPVTVLDVRGRWDFVKLGDLAALLRRKRIDLLHTHLFHADLAGRLAAHRAATPHLVHTVHVAEARFRPWQYAFARLTAGRCERVICVSNAVCRHHRRHSGLPPGDYIVIPNGIEAARFRRDEDLRRQTRREWGLADDQILLAFAGRLDKQKGIDTLLSAMSHLGARGNPANMVIAGVGPAQHAVENFIVHGEGGRHTRWLGLVPDIRPVLSAADILVMPSRWEGLGLSAGEAMAAGLPVIATSVAGLSELVIDGQTGILVAPDDVVGLVEAIERLAGDAPTREHMGQAGMRRVAEHYSMDTFIKAHERLYVEVAG